MIMSSHALVFSMYYFNKNKLGLDSVLHNMGLNTKTFFWILKGTGSSFFWGGGEAGIL